MSAIAVMARPSARWEKYSGEFMFLRPFAFERPALLACQIRAPCDGS
jgi:hypothetical protein